MIQQKTKDVMKQAYLKAKEWRDNIANILKYEDLLDKEDIQELMKELLWRQQELIKMEAQFDALWLEREFLYS